MRIGVSIIFLLLLLNSGKLISQLNNNSNRNYYLNYIILDSGYSEEVIIGVNWHMMDCKMCTYSLYNMRYKGFAREILRSKYCGPFGLIFNSTFTLEKMVSAGVYLPINSSDTNTNNKITCEKYHDPWIEFYTNFKKDTALSQDSINVLYRKFRPPNYPNIYRIPFYGFWRDEDTELMRIGLDNVRETFYLAVFKCRIKYKYIGEFSYPLINVYCKENFIRRSHGRYDQSVLEFERGICNYIDIPYYQILSIDSIEPVNLPPYAPYSKDTDTIYSYR